MHLSKARTNRAFGRLRPNGGVSVFLRRARDPFMLSLSKHAFVQSQNEPGLRQAQAERDSAGRYFLSPQSA